MGDIVIYWNCMYHYKINWLLDHQLLRIVFRNQFKVFFNFFFFFVSSNILMTKTISALCKVAYSKIAARRIVLYSNNPCNRHFSVGNE